jgi:hypothetical protein
MGARVRFGSPLANVHEALELYYEPSAATVPGDPLFRTEKNGRAVRLRYQSNQEER